MTSPTRHRSVWSADAKCGSGLPDDLTNKDEAFFPGKGRPPKVGPYSKWCDNCPVLAECLNWAVVHKPEGVWGGLTQSERERLPWQFRNRLVLEARSQGWYESLMFSSMDDLIQQYYPGYQFETIQANTPTPVQTVAHFDFDWELPEMESVPTATPAHIPQQPVEFEWTLPVM